MYKYNVLYKDPLFGFPCSARGRVNGNTRTEAAKEVFDFYENIISLKLQPVLSEDEFEYDGEWDI